MYVYQDDKEVAKDSDEEDQSLEEGANNAVISGKVRRILLGFQRRVGRSIVEFRAIRQQSGAIFHKKVQIVVSSVPPGIFQLIHSSTDK